MHCEMYLNEEGLREMEERIQAIHALARSALEAGQLSEQAARDWIVARNSRLRRDGYFHHVFRDVFGMQLTYRRLRQIYGRQK